MNNLEKLVPPLELCKQIPAGKFADSALVWNCRYGTKKGDRIVDLIERDNYDGGGLICPAPTLAEIWEALPLSFEDENANAGKGFEYFLTMVKCIKTNGLCNLLTSNFIRFGLLGCDMFPEEDDPNPATAALKLWLKVEGGSISKKARGEE